MRSLILFMLLLCTSCRSTPLTVHTEYFTREDLASVIVDTPDPSKNEPIFGQRLYISWSVPKEKYKANEPIVLYCQIRLQKGETIVEHIPVQGRSGTYIYPIIGKRYTKEGGLLSYKITLLLAGNEVATARHKFWVDEIKISD